MMEQSTMMELIKEIKYHDKLYWEDNTPEISDAEYDALVLKLSELDPNNEVLHKVHGSSSTREKVIHTTPMLSLAKIQTTDDLVKWVKSVARDDDEIFEWSSKKDGVSGEFTGTKLVTRGDGTVGFDISDRLPYVSGMVIPGPLHVGRGELLITKKTFKDHSPARQDGTAYKTERSAVSGLLNNTNKIPDDLVVFVPFDHDAIKFTAAEIYKTKPDQWGKLITDVKNSPWPTDGAVITLTDKEYGSSLGNTSHHPRHSVALKFGNESAITKVLDIVWTPGKHKLTPNAVLEPVEIEGFMNSKASLHNYDLLVSLGVMVGDTVEVERCNSIIPQIVRVVKTGMASKTGSITQCPACATEVEYVSPNLICPNKNCGGTKAKSLHDTITRLGIENIGPATVNDLVNTGRVNILALFTMTADDWCDLPGFALASAGAAYSEVQRVYNSEIEDYKVLAAMNIPGVGLSMSKKLLTNYTLRDLRAMSVEALATIDGIGRIRASLLYSGLTDFLLTKLMLKLDIIDTMFLSDQKLVCFTGKSSTPRSEWIKIGKDKGYTFKNSVTKDLALLVCGSADSTSTKAKKARKYGVKIMTYDEFMEVEDA